MAYSIAREWIGECLPFVAVAVVLAAGAASAQNSAAHPGPALRRPIVVAETGMHSLPAASVPARGPAPAAQRAASGVRPSTSGRFLVARPHATNTQPIGFLSARGSAARIFGAPNFARPFFFGAFFGGFGYPGSVSQLGGLPLGFGVWPACDSAQAQGVFWTVGPCFGSGAYTQEAAPSTTPEQTYILPLIVFEGPEARGSSAEQAPSTPSPAPTMFLYLSDGRTIPAADWWVTEGRFHYVTDTGAKGVLDLAQLDLEQTIKQNQKRGLEFHLNFTPPSERP